MTVSRHTREHDSSFSDQGVESIRKLANEDLGVCHSCSLPDLVISHRRSIHAAVTNVLGYRSWKQCRLLDTNDKEGFYKNQFRTAFTPKQLQESYVFMVKM